ncbi:MAG: hypothetical protein WBC61_03635 [Dehalococcoidia bacterium]
MKGWLKVVLVLALAALLGSTLLGCGGGGAGPEDTVRGALEAMEAMDAEKMVTYFTEEMSEDVEFGMEVVFALIDEIKISNVETKVLSQTEDEATVEVEFDLETTVFDETEEEHLTETYDLVKEDGKWLISEFEMSD